MARNFDIFQSWGAKMTFAPSYSFTLEGADEEDGSGVPFLDQVDKGTIGVEVDRLIIHWGCGALYPYGYLSRASSTNAQRSNSSGHSPVSWTPQSHSLPTHGQSAETNKKPFSSY